MNRLTQALAEACAQNVLAEKWLLAPSRRVGQQWLDAIARDGISVLNMHVKTLTSLALELAASRMTSESVSRIDPAGGQFLVDCALGGKKLSYLAGFESTAGLAEVMYATVNDIRLAGLGAQQLRLNKFEVADKGRDLKAILEAYEQELRDHHFIDDADALCWAVEALKGGQAALPAGVVLLVPADVESRALEAEFLAAFKTQGNFKELPIDDVAQPGDIAASDLQRLRWLLQPAAAPARPVATPLDGTVCIRRAVGEVNEVRDALRQCLAAGIPLDEVELLHTDAATYVPLVYETLSALECRTEQSELELPVTFAEGIPCSYSRPGRALKLWLAWIEDGYPQSTLVRMLRDGLVSTSPDDDGFTRLAGCLSRLGIGFGRDRYGSCIREAIEGIERRLAEGQPSTGEGDAHDPEWRDKLERKREELRQLDALCTALLVCSPDDIDSRVALLRGAKKFIESLARSTNELDHYATIKLQQDIDGMLKWIDVVGGASRFDAWDWLSQLADEARVLGSGPRPGCLHVAQALSGGHTGRPHTFIVGLDDSRFPGAGSQDPLLLDDERGRLSGALPTAARRLRDKSRDFVRMLARLRGTVTLSYSTWDVADDREKFPSGAVVASFRLISGQTEGDQTDLDAWLSAQGPTASFAPASEVECLSSSEWWLWRMCGTEAVHEPQRLVHQLFPHLAQGELAAEQRASLEFTEYDGYVPAAGIDLDPTRDDAKPLSAARLQRLGKCPLQFFFRHGLGVEPPEDLEVDPTQWLDAMAFGSLLHEVFEQFMRGLQAEGLLPDATRDEPRLRELLERRIEHYLRLYPKPSEGVYRRQRADLERTAFNFLKEEAQYCRQANSRPLYLEASLGMKSGEHGTPTDTEVPIAVSLGDGRRILLGGRVDRIDLVGSGAVRTYAIWDYKTGSTYGYDRVKPFQQGRVLQPYLYLTMVEHQLRVKIDPHAKVSQFGFFFPGVKAHGERIVWLSEMLAQGAGVLKNLVQIVADGAFLATNDAKDCTYCDYQAICHDFEATAAASKGKLGLGDNRVLVPLQELRS